MTATELHIVRDPAQLTASSLQKLFAELVAFTLDVKQAHWNLAGPAFLSLDTVTEDFVADARIRAGHVAKCAMALELPIDARTGTGAAVAGQVAADRIADHEAIAELVDLIDGVSATASRSLGELQQADPVAHDLTVGMVEGLARYRWMLWAQLAGSNPFPRSSPRDGRQADQPELNATEMEQQRWR